MPAKSKTQVLTATEYRATAGKRKATVAPLVVPPTVGELRSYVITYSGPGLSSNKWYAGMHFAQRIKLKTEWRNRFKGIIALAGIQPMQRFRVDLRYRARLDCDNTSAMLKLFCDQLKGVYVPEDDTKYFKGFSVSFAPELPHNTFIFTLSELP